MLNEINRNIVILNRICHRFIIPPNESYHQCKLERADHWRGQAVDVSKPVAVKVLIQEQDANIEYPSYRWESSGSAKEVYNAIIQTKYYQYFQCIEAMHTKKKTRCKYQVEKHTMRE